jgi:hypothetical protein
MTQEEINAHTDYASCVMSACYQRRFFATEGGRIGLGPLSIQPGDAICVLYGAETPFMMQPVTHDSTHIFRGECYIHGLMDGEAISLKEANCREDRNFIE